MEITTSTNHKYVFTLEAINEMPKGTMGFNMPMVCSFVFYFHHLFINLFLLKRKWAQLSINEVIDVRLYTFNPNTQYVSKITLTVDFMQKTAASSEPFDTDEMAKEFVMQFPKQSFTVGQLVRHLI